MQIVDYTNIEALRGAADIIESVSALVTYLGFCAPGTTATDAATWSILKIVQSGAAYPNETRFLWADGMCLFNKKWSERAEHTYTFKKF